MKLDGIRFRRAIVRAIPWTAVLLLPGCASSWRGPRGPEQVTLPRDPSTPTRLDRRLDAGSAGAPEGTSSVSLLATGDGAWARRHFEKAVAGFKSLGIEYAEDLAAVAENYCAFLREEGDFARADEIAADLNGSVAGVA